MIIKNNKLIPVILLLFALAVPIASLAQCKGFAKRKCLPELKPFVHNGQLDRKTAHV